MTFEAIQLRLIQAARGERTHPHYNRVCDISKVYAALSTGVGIEALMKPYSRREDAALFASRCELTEQITPSIIDSLSAFLEKGYRSYYRRELTYGSDQASEAKTQEFENMLSAYAGGMGVDGFLQARVLELQSTDPNAWIIQEWKDFDNLKELARPYPFEASAQQAIDFQYEFGDLQYLTVLTEMPGDPPIKRLTCYQKGISVTLTQTGRDHVDTLEILTLNSGQTIGIDGKEWLYLEYTNGLPNIMAKRVGYRRDKTTAGETFVWPFEAAEPYLKQTLKVVSELQLTAANVAMPQTVRFGDNCNAPECDGGHTPRGTCGSCKGTGKKKSSTSVLEEIVVTPMPESAADMIDLSKIIYYVSPEVSILQWQQQYVDELEKKCMKACLHSDVFTKSEVAETATGKSLDQDNANDFVYKYFRFYAEYWRFVVMSYAEIINKQDGLSAQIVVSKDLKLKTVNQLFDDLKQANESGAGAAAKQAIEWDIMRLTTIDNPREFMEYQVRERFNPFSGFTHEQQLIWAQSPLIPLEQRVLFANLGYVFDQIEFENQEFYKKEYGEQRAIVMAKVSEIIENNRPETPEIQV